MPSNVCLAQHDDSEAASDRYFSFERVRIEIDEFGILVSAKINFTQRR